MTALLLALVLPLAAPQTPTAPARDLFMHTERLPGIELRWVDYHWQPALFRAMETGKGDEPKARRNWVFARLVLQTKTMTIGGKLLGIGNYGVLLWPNLEGKGMEVEVRYVDMREVYPRLDAMAPCPPGRTMYRGPATLEPLTPLAERLSVALAEEEGGVTITLLYGDRRLRLPLRP